MVTTVDIADDVTRFERYWLALCHRLILPSNDCVSAAAVRNDRYRYSGRGVIRATSVADHAIDALQTVPLFVTGRTIDLADDRQFAWFADPKGAPTGRLRFGRFRD